MYLHSVTAYYGYDLRMEYFICQLDFLAPSLILFTLNYFFFGPKKITCQLRENVPENLGSSLGFATIWSWCQEEGNTDSLSLNQENASWWFARVEKL